MISNPLPFDCPVNSSDESDEKALNLIRIPEKENTQPGRFNGVPQNNGGYDEAHADSMQINGTLKIEALSSSTTSLARLGQTQDNGGKVQGSGTYFIVINY